MLFGNASRMTSESDLAKPYSLLQLNRLLGTRVPVELIISKQSDQAFTTAPLNDSQERDLAALGDREMTVEEKRRAVKLAAKMLQVSQDCVLFVRHSADGLFPALW